MNEDFFLDSFLINNYTQRRLVLLKKEIFPKKRKSEKTKEIVYDG